MTKLRLVTEDDLLDTTSVAGGNLAGAFGYSGVGSPIGKLDTAPTGTRYTDTAATSGAVEWTKYADGWRVTKGDTGLVQATLDPGTTTNHPTLTVWLRRINDVVHAAVAETSAAAAGTGLTTICSLPVGFGKADTQTTQTGQLMDPVTGGVLTANLFCTPTGKLKLYRAASSLHVGSVCWPAEHPWPVL